MLWFLAGLVVGGVALGLVVLNNIKKAKALEARIVALEKKA
jgi:hypothetical protein